MNAAVLVIFISSSPLGSAGVAMKSEQIAMSTMQGCLQEVERLKKEWKGNMFKIFCVERK